MPEWPAPAKVNLFLRILGRRPDGYHEIETLFQRIDLADRLVLEPAEGEGLELRCAGIDDRCGRAEDNLVWRAYAALSRHLAVSGRAPLPAVRALLEKRIPVGGGLGGGSSDAAAALVGLDTLFALGLGRRTLHRLAAELGADAPFFLGPPAAVGRGVGERLEPLDHPSRFWVVLALPDYGVSTAQVYGRYAEQRSEPSAWSLSKVTKALIRGDFDGVLGAMVNDMEPLAFALRPELGNLRRDLEKAADRPARMSGSGSTLFTLARSEEEALETAALWRAPALRIVTARFQAAETAPSKRLFDRNSVIDTGREICYPQQ